MNRGQAETLNLADLSFEVQKENSSLTSLEGKFVKVRGFWYPISSHEGKLALQPNLKSCCLGAPAKAHQQVIVKGAFASLSAGRAVTLQGIFKIEKGSNLKGQCTQVLVLEEATEVPSPSFVLINGIIGLFALLLWRWPIFLKRYHRLSKQTGSRGSHVKISQDDRSLRHSD